MDIYFVSIEKISKMNLYKLSYYISPYKIDRIKKFIDEKDKIRCLIGDILIRNIIIEKLRIKNENIVFNKNKYGKPYLKGYSKFKFNISHSGEFVTCVIDDNTVGIDIEQVKHIEYENIAKNFFSLNECNYIFRKDSNNKMDKFYKIWTLKESYIKYYGKGLSIPLNSFSINIDKYENIKVISDNKYDECMLKSFDIIPNYKMSVCYLNKSMTNYTSIINQDDLINRFLKNL